MLTFSRTDSNNKDFRELVSLLDKDLLIRDGDEHAFYAQFNKTDSIKNVIVCYENEKAVGIGSFKSHQPQVAEIKRMFVRPENRGNGIAFEILQRLEEWAAEEGYSECVLETGKKQPEAIHLYHKAGYKDIRNYGVYENVHNSVCMSKRI